MQSIAGLRFGKLPGEAPLHDNAEVLIEGFDVRSGRPVKLGPRLEEPLDRNYSVIAQPEWYRHRQETLCPLR